MNSNSASTLLRSVRPLVGRHWMSIGPLRSYVFETMRYGRLFRAGDAAHLSDALIQFYRNGEEDGLLGYAQKALDRIWKAERFSWMLTKLMHRFPDEGPFEYRMHAPFVRCRQATRPHLDLRSSVGRQRWHLPGSSHDRAALVLQASYRRHTIPDQEPATPARSRV